MATPESFVAEIVFPLNWIFPNVPVPLEAETLPLDAVMLPLATVRPDGNVVVPVISRSSSTKTFPVPEPFRTRLKLSFDVPDCIVNGPYEFIALDVIFSITRSWAIFVSPAVATRNVPATSNSASGLVALTPTLPFSSIIKSYATPLLPIENLSGTVPCVFSPIPISHSWVSPTSFI